MKWIKELSKELGTGEFKFRPARRIEIPKIKGGTRPLGIASPRDKIVQEAMRMVLEGIYEPTFSETSHGFRKEYSSETAINYIRMKFAQIRWFVEGDISKCFDRLDHRLIIEEIKKRIKDQRFIELLYKALKVGYIDIYGRLNKQVKGIPQRKYIKSNNV